MQNTGSFEPEADMAGLIQDARNGSEQALNELCDRIRPKLEELSRGRFNGPLRAKVPESDLVQESLLGLSQNFPRFQGRTRSDLMAWVRGILENKSLELQRRFLQVEKRNIFREFPLQNYSTTMPGGSLPDSAVAPLERMISVEEAARVKALTSQLPSHYRTVIELRFLNELSFPEIAQRMNRSEPSVKNIFVRAMQTLSQGLKFRPETS